MCSLSAKAKARLFRVQGPISASDHAFPREDSRHGLWLPVSPRTSWLPGQGASALVLQLVASCDFTLLAGEVRGYVNVPRSVWHRRACCVLRYRKSWLTQIGFRVLLAAATSTKDGEEVDRFDSCKDKEQSTREDSPYESASATTMSASKHPANAFLITKRLAPSFGELCGSGTVTLSAVSQAALFCSTRPTGSRFAQALQTTSCKLLRIA